MDQTIPVDVTPMAATPQAAQPEVFDLATVEDVDHAEVQLKRAGQPLPIFITMAGPEHAKRKAHAMSKQRKLRKQLSRTGKVDFGDPADDEAEETGHLADSILAWRGVVFSGAAMECTRPNVLQLLTDPKRAWFRRAVREVFEDAEAFITASASS